MFAQKINQDCIENFFGSIRQQNGNYLNPTPIQFTRAFKLFSNESFTTYRTQNCVADTDNI